MPGCLITRPFFLTLVGFWRGYFRARDPLLRDVMLIFATVAMLFVYGIIRRITGTPPDVVTGIISALWLGQPFLTLRLVSRLHRVPAWVMWAAAAGWLLSSAPVVALAP